MDETSDPSPNKERLDEITAVLKMLGVDDLSKIELHSVLARLGYAGAIIPHKRLMDRVAAELEFDMTPDDRNSVLRIFNQIMNRYTHIILDETAATVRAAVRNEHVLALKALMRDEHEKRMAMMRDNTRYRK